MSKNTRFNYIERIYKQKNNMKVSNKKELNKNVTQKNQGNNRRRLLGKIKCNNCKYEGIPKTKLGGSYFLFIVLIFSSIFFFPLLIIAIIYGFGLLGGTKAVCRNCKSFDIIKK